MITSVYFFAISLIALVEANRIAIIFTDIKLDDKSAIHILGQSGEYDKLISVISGVYNHDSAHGDLVDFLETMNTPIDDQSFVVLSGKRKGKPAPHEEFFVGEKKDCDGIFESSIEKLISPKAIVDVFQIAPTPREHIDKLAEVASIRTYHLVHGYNSKQGDDDFPIDWLKSIKPTITKRSPSARIIFTNNFASFVPEGTGSSQPFSSLVHVLPEAHLEAALNDPFHLKKFKECQAALKDGKISINTPIVPDNYNYEDLGQLILRARKNENEEAERLRRHFIAYIDEAAKHLEGKPNLMEKKTYDRFTKNVRKSFTTPLMVEMCDANHILAVRTATEDQFKPILLELSAKKDMVKITPATATDNDGTSLFNLSADTILEDLLPLLSNADDDMDQSEAE